MALEVQLDGKVAITGLGGDALKRIFPGVTELGFHTAELHPLQVGERITLYIYLFQKYLTDRCL